MGMNTKTFYEKHGIDFIVRGEHSLYVNAASARDLVGSCQKEGCLIVGIEGFRITDNETRAIDSLVADFSEIKSPLQSCDEALAFLSHDSAQVASHFDFTISFDGCAD